MRKRPHTLSLSLSLTLSLYTRAIQLLTKSATTSLMFFALSHIYTHMTFGLFTHLSFPIGRTDRNGVFGHPVLPNSHPEGPVSQQTLSLKHLHFRRFNILIFVFFTGIHLGLCASIPLVSTRCAQALELASDALIKFGIFATSSSAHQRFCDNICIMMMCWQRRQHINFPQ